MDFSTIPLPLLSFSWVFFISSTLIHQMANTRNYNNNNNGDNNGENNKNVNPPPPRLPTLEQVLAMQAKILQTMQQTTVNMQAAQPQAPPPPPRDRLGDFQCTKPPTFSRAVELMDVDDWIKYVEKKLQVVQCNNYGKLLLASHQLLVVQPTGGMLTWKPIRNLRATIGRNSEQLSMQIMFPKELSS
jgi:hypothetical protein